MKIFYSPIASIILLMIGDVAFAAIRPSFAPEACAWRATDIVVVTEGYRIDGVLEVIETWKGDLKPGETINVPELGTFKEKDARVIHSSRWYEKPDQGTAEYVSGDRMILFLRDAKKTNDDDEEDTQDRVEAEKSTSRWQSANPMGNEMKVSVAWIEKGRLYCFVQIMNPGESVLINFGTETDLKTQVSCVLSTQSGLNTALAIPDLKARAESLEPFAHDSIFLARNRAFTGLTECGEAALPVLKKIFENESLREFHGDAVEAFAKAGGKAAGPELTSWVAKELEFWKQTGPMLQVNWAGGNGFGTDQFEAISAAKPLVNRSWALSHAVYALGAIRYEASEPVLIELSNLWRSLPQLYGDSVSDACDEILREFGTTRKDGISLRLPKYEVSFTGNKAFSTTVLTAKIAEYVAAFDRLDKEPERGAGDPFRYASDRLIGFITSQGYLDVRLGSSQKSTAQGELISIEVDEGRQYRLGKIKIKGAKQFSAERIRGMINVREGDIADGEAINQALYTDLEGSYQNLGYLNCRIERDRQARADSDQPDALVVDYQITIDEGPRYKVRDVKLEGRTNLQKDQLNQAMVLHHGDVYSRKQLDDSIDALNKLGLDLDKIKDVGVTHNHTEYFVDIVIVLNKDRRVTESFNRSVNKPRWYP